MMLAFISNTFIASEPSSISKHSVWTARDPMWLHTTWTWWIFRHPSKSSSSHTKKGVVFIYSCSSCPSYCSLNFSLHAGYPIFFFFKVSYFFKSNRLFWKHYSFWKRKLYICVEKVFWLPHKLKLEYIKRSSLFF